MELGKDQICEGCLIFEEDECFIRKAQQSKKCPCRNCLVKGMCQKMCDDYRKFMNNVYATLRIANE